MRRKLVAGNWKMNLTSEEARETAERLRTLIKNPIAEVVICPPFLSIAGARQGLGESTIKLGAQNVFWMTKGAFTGQVSASMLKAEGCTYCIVGHSETRGKFGKLEIPAETVCHFAENDHTVNLKIEALIEENITPILCVGETQPERDAGMTDAIITTQLEKAVQGIGQGALSDLVVAYEPVWAIGTGNVCDANEAERVCGLIRKVIASVVDRTVADSTRVLYGGSVKASNAAELFHQPNIDGGLIGGASLDPDEFAQIVAAA